MKNEEVINNQQNENDNKKKNYFNLIIGLTTLIIAILGASFAYFTVRGGSEENEIAVQAAYVKIGYEGGTKVKASDLIPASQSVMLWAYRDVTKQNTAFEGDPEDPEAPTTYQCLDKNNKKVCYVYRFTINAEGEENGTTKILGKIKVGTNSFVQTTDVSSALVYNQYIDANDSNASNNTGDSSATYTDAQVYYIVVWLSETGTNQTVGSGQPSVPATNIDFFNGKVTFVTAQGNEITSTFNGYSIVQPNTVGD